VRFLLSGGHQAHRQFLVAADHEAVRPPRRALSIERNLARSVQQDTEDVPRLNPGEDRPNAVMDTLPPRERELVILRTGWRCGSEYEFGQHTVIGLGNGLDDADIVRLTGPVDASGWSTGDALLIRVVDELVDDHCLSDETWGALVASWTTQQVIDLVLAVGQYQLVSMALRSFGVQREPGVPGFPA
jgi:Carboxymuconolactone decarboxylase family